MVLQLVIKNGYWSIISKVMKTGEAIMRYVKDFARIMVLTDEDFNDTELRIITGFSEETIRGYKNFLEIYSTEDYQDRSIS